MKNTEGSNGLQINENTLYYWQKMTPWIKFFSVLGFVLAGCALVGLRYLATLMVGFVAIMGADTLSKLPAGMTFALFAFAVIFIGFIVVMAMTSLNHWRFARNIKTAIENNSQDTLERAWKNMAQSWRIYGYMMIITLVLFAIFFVVAGSNAMNILHVMLGSIR